MANTTGLRFHDRDISFHYSCRGYLDFSSNRLVWQFDVAPLL